MKSIFISLCMLFILSCEENTKTRIKMKQNTNKQLILDFYQKVIGEQDLNYAKRMVTEDYIQHNPRIKTGKDGFLEAIAFLKKIPKPKNPTQPLMRVIVEDEFVVVHWNVEFGGQQNVVLDMFRIENGLIAEHWDAIQATSQKSIKGTSEVSGPILIEDEEKTSLNKKIVKDFTTQVLINKDFEKSQNFLAVDLIQHIPKIANGRKAFMQYCQNIKTMELHKIIGQGNFVVTQSKVIVDNEDWVSYSIYRLQNGYIVEHWNVSQRIPKSMTHGNGMI